ncbi:Poly-gamma-glutamate synthase subunit PgsB/CapB [Enhygromyxa salina]|uniref:Poly-gamma-glutamate synthase subunit PgsB/CapB n=1 Tax=Enhygromyxa salina TaxID=215803 RepID=A0A0C2CUR2_9BACT|nr:Poly-gamma-glutamate synthase subunit PgsB/CapB [Enhygromyxa salina]
MAALVQLIEQVLPPLQARCRRDRLEPLALRIAELTDPRDFAGEDRLGLRLASLAVLTVRVIGQLQLELAELERHVANHVEAYARAKTDTARRNRLELMIDETAADARAARADRLALSRHLDLDALRERYDDQREVLVVAIELGIMIVGPAIEQALVAEDWDASSSFVHDASLGLYSEVRTVLAQVEPVSFLLNQLSLLRRWPSRLACLESLEAALACLGLPILPALPAIPALPRGRGYRNESPQRGVTDLRAGLLVIAEDVNEHEWVQARAIACLRRVDPEVHRACVRRRLGLDATTPPEWPKRDFLVRGLVIQQLAAQLEHSAEAELLAEAIALGDPSEFVRIAHANALEHLALERPESFFEFARLLTRVGDGAAPVEMPRVHASACLAMVRGLRVASDTQAGEQVAEVIVERLVATIVGISNPLIARVACEQAAATCELLAEAPGLESALQRHAHTLVEALHTCLADVSRSASIHEAVSIAIEQIDVALRRERAAWTKALNEAVQRVPSGGQRRIPLPSHEGQRPSHDELVRILPMLTRNDWGLDVDQRGKRLLVRRGDHRVTRMWRTLHELRHPAGNKRQAFRHTVGRRLVGKLRAHPGRLDEVTATVVPGERLNLDAEGGWGRHLPLVDDLLGLQWLRGLRRDPVEVLSSHGVTSMRLRGNLARRLWSRWRLNFRYAELSELRRRALMADEPSERRRYADELRNRYGVELEFRAHPSVIGERPVPPRLRALFPGDPSKAAPEPEAPTEPTPDPETDPAPEAAPLGPAAVVVGTHAPAPEQPRASLIPIASLSAGGAALPDLRAGMNEWLRDNLHYFLTLEGNSQEALGLFALGLSGWFLGSGYARRRKIAQARAAIPLSIGGWGTRGKSGTERLKAGLFHGLGFRTFSKTTGCEAMFIHSVPLGPQVEIYTFRPYGKATIWEQRNLLVLAAGLKSEVFLWECMALNPEYVDILQRGWMRDDFATITNTYPDHEDIQGPAGIDVATVIGRFIPEGNLVVSSELAFNPVLRDSAKERGAELLEIGDYEGDLLPDDLLGLFPYSEHPRNIALVTELARQLGIDDELAIVCMADYVYPDLGVLKFYPDVQVRGRTLSFVNGCSANERAGFLNNWKRTGCVDLAAAGDPARMVITVVNNRDDRVSRSEVFSRILVNDVAVDAHVLIGTNLAGLQIFVDRALENFAAEQELVDAEALVAGGAGHERARNRLKALFGRVRGPVEGWWEQLCTLLRLGLAALGRRFDPDSAEALALQSCVAKLRGSEGSHEFEPVVARLASDKELNAAVRQVHDRSAEDPTLIHPHEVGRAADYEDLLAHLRDRIARIVIAGRFAAKLEPVLEARSPAALTSFTTELTRAWITLFRAQVIIVWDSGATGDQIIDQCARAVPPGVHVTVMGTQNIKGTGLDFIYRWLALDAVCIGLDKLDSDDEQTRLDALRSLDAHSDFGFTDTGMMVKRLPEMTKGSGQEASLRAALREKADAIHRQKLAKLDSAGGAAAKGGKFWTSIEGWIDFMDGAVRYRQSRQLVQDLVDFRVSHNKMAVEMREIYARAKGGWLGKALAAKLKARKSG